MNRLPHRRFRRLHHGFAQRRGRVNVNLDPARGTGASRRIDSYRLPPRGFRPSAVRYCGLSLNAGVTMPRKRPIQSCISVNAAF